MSIKLLKTEDYVVTDCILDKNPSECDVNRCYRCGWNRKELLRRKNKIRETGLEVLKNKDGVSVRGLHLKGRKTKK